MCWTPLMRKIVIKKLSLPFSNFTGTRDFLFISFCFLLREHVYAVYHWHKWEAKGISRPCIPLQNKQKMKKKNYPKSLLFWMAFLHYQWARGILQIYPCQVLIYIFQHKLGIKRSDITNCFVHSQLNQFAFCITYHKISKSQGPRYKEFLPHTCMLFFVFHAPLVPKVKI